MSEVGVPNLLQHNVKVSQTKHALAIWIHADLILTAIMDTDYAVH